MPRIAFTFDDDPKTEPIAGTPELLRVIHELNQQHYNIKVTFFVVGVNAKKHIDLLKAMADQGHEIGNHSFTHCNLAKLPLDEAIDEVRKTHDLITQTISRPPTYFRAPYGALTKNLHDEIVKQFPGYRCVGWHTPHDEKDSADAAFMRHTVVNRAFDGRVVLVHAWKQATLYAMRNIFTTLRDRHYQFVTVRDLNSLPSHPLVEYRSSVNVNGDRSHSR